MHLDVSYYQIILRDPQGQGEQEINILTFRNICVRSRGYNSECKKQVFFRIRWESIILFVYIIIVIYIYNFTHFFHQILNSFWIVFRKINVERVKHKLRLMKCITLNSVVL